MNRKRAKNFKKCPWCGHTPEMVDARKVAGCREDGVEHYDERYPYFVRCINAMCNVQPTTQGADTEELAVYQWNSMQSASILEESRSKAMKECKTRCMTVPKVDAPKFNQGL